MQHTLEAMNNFSLQVEQLLNSEDQKLYRALQKLLRSPTRTRFGISQEELPFHKRLRNIIHPHVQKMLVGMYIPQWPAANLTWIYSYYVFTFS